MGPGCTFDGTEVAQKILSATIRTGERFGANYIIQVLRGSRSKRVLAMRHDELSVYGIAAELSTSQLVDFVDQLVSIGLLTREPGALPILFVTDRGREFLRGRGTVNLAGAAGSSSAKGISVDGYDSHLFEKLRALRGELAGAARVPAYFVFSDATLREMAASLPRDRGSLLRIKGVGEFKLRQFGDQFIAVIADHALDARAEWARASSSIGTSSTPHSELLSQTRYVTAPAPSPAEKLASSILAQPVRIQPGTTAMHEVLQYELDKVLATLREREAHVLKRRFGLEDGRWRTLQQVGEDMGVSRERIRQIEKKALKKLRHPSRLRPLKVMLEKNTASADGSDSSHMEAPHQEPRSGSYVDQVRTSRARAYEPWSPDEDQQLTSLHEDGRSIGEIASILDRQPSAIRSRLRRSGSIP